MGLLLLHPLAPLPLTTTASASANAKSTRPRPAVILPGLGNNSRDYSGLAATLRDRYGVPSVTARISRLDWLRNAAGLLDPNYWTATLRPRPILDWYLHRVHEAVSQADQLLSSAHHQDDIVDGDDGGGISSSISLIGHSAGGWLARVYMQEFASSRFPISLLLTLGTPHLPPPKGLSGVIDQTRGLLDYVERNCAPAVYTPELKYICISGRYIKGARLASNSDETSDVVLSDDKDLDIIEPTMAKSTSKPNSVAPTLRERFIGQGYKQVCGQADVWGDGVVPELSAHLEGALNISLEGVYHSPFSSDDKLRPWYGSPAIVDKWVHHLLN